MKAYGLNKVLDGVSYEDAIVKVTAALKEEGFGVLTTIDMKATFKKKLDVDFQPYTILGACNPPLAHQALTADPEIGLLLPCNVVVQKVEGGTSVSAIDPQAMFSVVDNPAMDSIVEDVKGRLNRVMEAL